jgi:glycosyltransferase involved in cell wall biosynthesis
VSRISVMQVIDTLDAGGAERVAVNFANLLPRDRYTSWLCTTRRDGALADLVVHDVKRLALDRKTRLDIPPLRRLADVVRTQGIHILHAHGASLFVGLFASLRPPYPAVIWHVHHLHQRDEYPAWLYRLVAARAAAVVTVSQQVADWARRRLRISADRVVYLPNFSIPCGSTDGAAPALPGTKGFRIACVANLRPQKDQCTLIDAFARVAPAASGAHLLLVGGAPDAHYRAAVQRQIVSHGLEAHVSLLGERADVPAILAQCDIAVLSSTTEGFPLSLVEYGHAGLPVVATRVGQCADVLDNGNAGLLVDPRNAEQLGAALLSLWHSRAQRRVLGKRLQHRVHERYSSEPTLRQLCGLYERFAATRRQGPHLS